MSAKVSPFGDIRAPKKRAFLVSLVQAGGNITKACELAKIDPSTPYTRQWKKDEAFQAVLAEAKEMGADHLEGEAIRRAYEGVKEPVGWHKGEPGGYVQRYSDTLMIFLLKGAKKDKYVERHQHTGEGGGPIIVTEVVHEYSEGEE